MLIDYDRVEAHNLLRQHFYPGDVGKFKSEVMASRLSRQFGRPIKFSVYPYDNFLVRREFNGGLIEQMPLGLIIGCVDNATARSSIADGFSPLSWWIDAGNNQESGQVFIGNARYIHELDGSFDEETGKVTSLPIPTLQEPALLLPPSVELTPRRDCAEEVAIGDQNPLINQVMANLVLQFVYKLLTNKLTWMAGYIDFGSGTMQMVPAEPENVASKLGVEVDTLIANKCSVGNHYYNLRR